MRLADLKSVFLENIENLSIKKLGLAEIVNHADENLAYPASDAITSFVGGPHDAIKMGQQFGIMQSKKLEDAYSNNPSQEGLKIKQQLESAFEPVKKYLKQKFGNTIKLYRAQRMVKAQSLRNTLSWTSNERVAAEFAGIEPWEMKLQPITNEMITQALQTYNTTGLVKFNGKTYKRTETPVHKNYDLNLDDYYYDIWDNDELITDGDNLQEEFKDIQQYIQSLIDEREAKKKEIITALIPIDDIIWITDRFNQSEFIVKNNPRSSAYITANHRDE